MILFEANILILSLLICCKYFELQITYFFRRYRHFTYSFNFLFDFKIFLNNNLFTHNSIKISLNYDASIKILV